MIQNDIEIVVLDTKGDTVKLGIIAPASVKIFREEIYAEIRHANELSKSVEDPGVLDRAIQFLDNPPGQNPKKS